jgi:hypothetical protein
MAIPFPTTYYLGIGTAISNLGVMTELSGGSYARLACNFTGSALSGLTQTVGPWVVATAPTPAVNSLYGMIFDAVTAGNLIAYWTWSAPFTGSLTAFPSTVINLGFNTYIQQALNLSLLGGSGTSGSQIDQGSQIGIAQGGNPLIAGTRLSLQNGALVALAPTTKIIDALNRIEFVVGGVNVGYIDSSGNLVLGGLLYQATATTPLINTAKLPV